MNTPLGIIISNLAVLLQYSQALGAIAAAARQALAELDDPTRAHAVAFGALRQVLGPVDLDYVLDDLPQFIEESTQGSNWAAAIVRSLATFARRDPYQFSTVAVEDSVDSAITLAWNALKHRAEVVKAFGGVPPVLGHASELTQVFVHLLLNAAQALEGTAGQITLRSAVQGHHVVASITDTGRGIPPEDLPRLFDPFFTTRPPGQGTGLGLAVCHGIITRHGGTIDLDSTLGQGTTVTVRLPLVQLRAEAP
jgi:signal transduction histidine kinase